MINKFQVNNCPFCNPRVVKNSVFAKSKNFLAIYNISPILPGHSLIIPKKHIDSMTNLNDEELCEMTVFSKKVVTILLKTFNTTAFNWTIQEGAAAGQTISHLHLHLIPREENDLPNPGDWYPMLRKSETEIIDSGTRPRLKDEQILKIVNHIKENFKKG